MQVGSFSKSDANGNSKVINKKYSHDSDLFDIFRYDKTVLTYDDYDKTGLFRSVIFKGEDLVCFSPPKAMQFDMFSEKYPTISESITFEEFVEGTMINLFFNPKVDDDGNAIKDKDGVYKGSIEISTRSTVGGNVSFFQYESAPSFRYMFIDACMYWYVCMH